MPETLLPVTLVVGLAQRHCHCQPLQLPEGSTVADAVRSSGVMHRLSADWDAFSVTVWGRKAELTQVLRAGDRVELLRPLRVDPKVARRERFNRQGARGVGLFARRKSLPVPAAKDNPQP